MDYRRRERLTAGRNGVWRMEDDPGAQWRHCRLVDVSMHGLGIYVQHPTPSALIGGDVTVDISPFEDSVKFRLHGSVREAMPTRAEGVVRVGVAFGKLAASERYMIDVLTWSDIDRRSA